MGVLEALDDHPVAIVCLAIDQYDEATITSRLENLDVLLLQLLLALDPVSVLDDAVSMNFEELGGAFTHGIVVPNDVDADGPTVLFPTMTTMPGVLVDGDKQNDRNLRRVQVW